MVLTFFWFGVAVGSYTWCRSLQLADIKTGPLVFPFLMLLAAAVAKYIGL